MSSKLDDFILTLGQPGKLQVIGASFLCFSFMGSIALNYMLSFATMTPTHHCQLDQNSSWSKNLTLPMEEVKSTLIYNKCKMFVDPTNHSLGHKTCDMGYEYMPSDVQRYTAVTEWDLVCDSKYLVRVFQTIFFVGILVGGAIGGFLADWYGRKHLWVISSLLHLAVAIPLHFIYNFEAYCALSFLRGAVIQMQTTAAYSALMELFPGRFRTIASVIALAVPSVSTAFATAICYFLPHWRDQLLFHGMSTILNIIGFYFVKENVRWLVVSQRVKRAYEVSKSYAKFNGIDLRKDAEEYIEELAEEVRRSVAASAKKQSLTDFMRHAFLRNVLIIFCASMFVAQVCVYGFNFTISELGGNVYVNFALLSCGELTARLLSYFAVEKLGRRVCTCLTLFISGTMNLLLILLKTFQAAHPVILYFIIAVGLIGRIFNGVYFITSLIQATEIIPTTIRSSATGLMITTGRFGLLILPGILLLGDYVWSELPFLLFGILGVTVGLWTLLLPETKGRPLPNTIDEVLNIYVKDYQKAVNGTTEAGQPMLSKTTKSSTELQLAAIVPLPNQ